MSLMSGSKWKENLWFGFWDHRPPTLRQCLVRKDLETSKLKNAMNSKGFMQRLTLICKCKMKTLPQQLWPWPTIIDPCELTSSTKPVGRNYVNQNLGSFQPHRQLESWPINSGLGRLACDSPDCFLMDKLSQHSDKKILIQNVKPFSSGTNAQTVWLVVYKYSD